VAEACLPQASQIQYNKSVQLDSVTQAPVVFV